MTTWTNEQLFLSGDVIDYDTTGGLWLDTIYPWQELLPWQIPAAEHIYDDQRYHYDGYPKIVWSKEDKNITSWSTEVATPTTWTNELQ